MACSTSRSAFECWIRAPGNSMQPTVRATQPAQAVFMGRSHGTRTKVAPILAVVPDSMLNCAGTKALPVFSLKLTDGSADDIGLLSNAKLELNDQANQPVMAVFMAFGDLTNGACALSLVYAWVVTMCMRRRAYRPDLESREVSCTNL